MENNTLYLGNVFLLGDSYSTFEGFIPYPKDAAWYRANGTDFYGNKTLSSPKETWWWRLLESCKYNSFLNASFSGTTIGYMGWNYYGEKDANGNVLKTEEDGRAYDKEKSFPTRLNTYLANGYFNKFPTDTFLLFGGTNDVWANGEYEYNNLGEPKYGAWTEEDMLKILPAICRLIDTIKTKIAPKRFVFILNDDICAYDQAVVPTAKNAYNKGLVAAIREICAHYDIGLVETQGVEKIAGHPNEKGMQTIFAQVRAYLENGA